MTNVNGYGFNEFLIDLCNQNQVPDDEVLKYLSHTNLTKLESLLKRLEKVRSLKAATVVAARKPTHRVKTRKQAEGQQARMVGALLERVIAVLLNGCKCIAQLSNVRTTISEIDFLVQTNTLAAAIPMFKAAMTHLIGEAKCYASGLKVEWINELVGVMQAHSATHSILFVACPSKKLRPEHRHAIQLQSVAGSKVIPFGMAQLNEVLAGKNFLKVLSDQYVKALNATNELCI